MSSERRFMSADMPEAVVARLHAATAEPLSTAIDDGLNLHWTAQPGEAPLVGRISGMHVRVWRRGQGNWVGMNSCTGEVCGLETGTALVGVATLRWSGRVANALIALMIVATLATAASIGWGQFVGAAMFWAVGAAFNVLIQRRDRRLLMEVIGRVVTGSSGVT